MKRRIFLRGVGGAALAAPFLSSLQQRSAGAQEAANPRRLVIFYTNNGCLTNRWFPSIPNGQGAVDAGTLAGTTLQGLSPFADKLLFPRGLALYPAYLRGQTIDPHDQAMGSKLTCAPIAESGSRYAQGRSLDHVLADLVNPGGRRPLVLSVGFANSNVKQVLSYSAPNEAYVPETNPQNVYNGLTNLFQGDQETEADHRIKRGESIIDLVKDDLDTFKRLNMSQADEKRIDDWLTLLRETETPIVSAACTADGAASLGVTSAAVSAAGGTGGGGGGNIAHAMMNGGDMMTRLIALSMMCDANRVAILQWPSFVTFNFDGMNHPTEHHGLSHRVGSAAVAGTCVDGVMGMLREIDEWYAARYVQLVTLLNSIGEGDGQLLDNTACMWLPELADGQAHNTNNLPIVIAGSCGGYLRTGTSVNVAGGNLQTGNSEASCQNPGDTVGMGDFNSTGSNGGMVPLNKLYVTLMNAVGGAVPGWVPVDTFGQVDSSNIQNGITNPGELTELKA